MVPANWRQSGPSFIMLTVIACAFSIVPTLLFDTYFLIEHSNSTSAPSLMLAPVLGAPRYTQKPPVALEYAGLLALSAT